MQLAIGIAIGVVIARWVYEARVGRFFVEHLLCIFSFGLLYYAKDRDNEAFKECWEKLRELGVSEETLNCPEKLADFLKEHVKLVEKM